MAKTTSQQPRYLLITTDQHGEYFHVTARAVTTHYEGGARLPWGLDDEYGKDVLLTGLRVSSQGDDKSRQRGEEPLYGFHIEYRDMYRVDATQAHRMAKTLDKIDKGMAKLYAYRGRTKSFGEYVGRVAEVLGCEGIVFDQQQDYTSARYVWHSVGDGVNHIDYVVREWQKPVQTTEEVAS